MNFESIVPLLLPVALILILFQLEALVLFFFKMKSFLGSLGVSALVNVMSLVVLYGVGHYVVPLFGYDVNGFPLPVVALLWWTSIVGEGFFLQLFIKKGDRARIFQAAIVMNTVSFLFFFLAIINRN